MENMKIDVVFKCFLTSETKVVVSLMKRSCEKGIKLVEPCDITMSI